MTEVQESNRDRVRRCLFEPLGFRWPKGKPEAAGKAELDAIADELAYLSDDDLATMARMMRVHGDGSARCFWPPRATFTGFAHVVRPRPLVEDPALLRWWASVEGQRMVQDGTLVETYQYFERHRMPPVKDGPRAKVAEVARDNRRRLQVIDEREALGYPVDPQDAAWRRWYRDRLAMLTALVDQARARKAGQAA